ncbi:MAG: hypothetical protein ABSE62_02385 [Chthoniobacteraceae bacterium]|jgi:hypothetical protein
MKHCGDHSSWSTWLSILLVLVQFCLAVDLRAQNAGTGVSLRADGPTLDAQGDASPQPNNPLLAAQANPSPQPDDPAPAAQANPSQEPDDSLLAAQLAASAQATASAQAAASPQPDNSAPAAQGEPSPEPDNSAPDAQGNPSQQPQDFFPSSVQSYPSLISPETPYFGAPTYMPQGTAPTTYGDPRYGYLQSIPSSQLDTTQQYGVSYSSIYPLTGYDGSSIDPLSNHILGMDFDQGIKLGGAYGSIDFGSGGFGVPQIPLVYRAFPPDDADVKLGPLYFKVNSFEADFLYTDNYRQSNTDRQEETFAILTLNMSLVAQLTDDIQMGINGSLIYLPLQNIIGLTTSSLNGAYGYLLAAVPQMLAQVSYDTLIAGWDVRFADNFSTSTGAYSDGTRDEFSLFQGGVLAPDGPGRYTFHSGQLNLRNNSANFYGGNENYFAVFANTVSALTYHELPGDIDFTGWASHSDYWYDPYSSDLPFSQDQLYLLWEAARPNMRFTPYFSYYLSHVSTAPGVFQVLRAGFFGPVTDQLYLNTNIGYFIGDEDQQSLLWMLTLDHVAGPYTSEHFEVTKGISYYDDEEVTTEYYRLLQTLGPTLQGTLVADHSEYQELNSQYANRTQEDVGAGITWWLGPLTTMQFQGVYSHQDYDNGFDTDTWTGRVTLWRILSDDFFFRAFYQYQRYSPNAQNRGYYENLVFLTLVKYFP